MREVRHPPAGDPLGPDLDQAGPGAGRSDRGRPILLGLAKSVQICPLSASVSKILNMAMMAAYDEALTVEGWTRCARTRRCIVERAVPTTSSVSLIRGAIRHFAPSHSTGIDETLQATWRQSVLRGHAGSARRAVNMREFMYQRRGSDPYAPMQRVAADRNVCGGKLRRRDAIEPRIRSRIPVNPDIGIIKDIFERLPPWKVFEVSIATRGVATTMPHYFQSFS
jgi:hypothetical protein